MSNTSAQAPALSTGEWHPKTNVWLITVAVMAPVFMVALASTVVNVAVPYIAGNISASPEEATWTLTSYLAANAVMMPATGWLSRAFGRKNLLLACVAVFSLASLACGAATTLDYLVLARVLQGLAGGAMQPISQAVLLESFPPAKRGVAMAFYGFGVIFAPIIGPVLGGWIIDNYSWRWLFFINLPVGVVALLLGRMFLEDPPYIRSAKVSRIDAVGLSLLSLWVASLLIMLDKGQQDNWFSSVLIRVLLVLFVLGLAGFVAWELRIREPIVNLRVLRDRNFLVGSILGTAIGAVMFGCIAILPLFLQTLLRYPAVQSGWAMTPRGLGALVGMVVIGRVIGILDARLLVVAGFLLLGYSTYALGDLNLGIAPINIIWPNIVNGAATGLIFVPLTVITMGNLRNEEMGNATGIYNLVRNIGAAAGIAMLTTLLARGSQVHQNFLVSHMTPFDPAYQLHLHIIQSGLRPFSGSWEAARQARAVIGGQLTRQSHLWAYVDVFRLLAVLSVACVPPVFLLRRLRYKKKSPGPAKKQA